MTQKLLTTSLFLPLIILVIILVPASTEAGSPGGPEQIIMLGKFTKSKLDNLIRSGSEIEDPGERIGFISESFLGTDYEDNTLVGSNDTEEILTVNLQGVDCFTFIDYVEAMRLSADYEEFISNLVKTRYRNAKITYTNRNHFFTDWHINNDESIIDVTREIGRSDTSTNMKHLNRIDDNSRYLKGIEIVERSIDYIPSERINESVVSEIQTGDYLGIYSRKPGLDVSHTGIAVRKQGKLFIRHASSRKETGKVVDEHLINYLNDKPGLVILRAIGK